MTQQPAAPEGASVPRAAAPESAATATVSVSVNGEARAVPAGTDLDALVGTLTRARSGVAAAVNESVVPRGQWAATTLGDGDRVEVLTAVQGG
ncbi:sulfur carrier protein [Streptomyces sp. Ncost-T6T-1]|uniref:sulfur carrier protein ThiS n=1 Tax=Streptomyces sp. Ncost-T6T-1 TaxID=1100828 RepID=UPI00080511A2|nr:sulfur carrier protein ThiS [Streptomyces sp. Ncost-T6T-1]SBU88743.1 sulfur carrier protein [Streptomyces sp. Ncost-T6T-1]